MPRSHDEHSSLAAARRRFLIKTLGLGAAGLAAGGAAAWTKGQLDEAAVAATSLANLRSQLEQVTAAKTDLALSYGTLQAQAADLQVRLDAANNQSAELAAALSTAHQEKADLQSRLATVQGELDATRDRLANVTQLVGLFEQLEGTGLDDVVLGGMGAVAGALDGLANPAALLGNGLAVARSLLSTFESALPDFKAAMGWLGEQVVRLKVGLWSVETSAEEFSNSVAAGFAAAFGGFVGFVIDHLPFDIGKKVRATLGATQSVLAGLVDMTDNAADRVLLKISKYVDDGPQNWKQTLVAPLREVTLAPADEVLTGVARASATYKVALKEAANPVLDKRRALREQIANFRATHGV